MPYVRREFTECAERNIGIDESERKGKERGCHMARTDV